MLLGLNFVLKRYHAGLCEDNLVGGLGAFWWLLSCYCRRLRLNIVGNYSYFCEGGDFGNKKRRICLTASCVLGLIASC